MPPSSWSAAQKKLSEIEREAIEQQAQNSAKHYGLLYFSPLTLKVKVDLEALNLIPEPEARAGQLAVISKNKQQLQIILVNPEGSKTKELINNLLNQGFDCQQQIASLPTLKTAWEKYQEPFFPLPPPLGTIIISQQIFSSLEETIKNLDVWQKKLALLATTDLLEVIIAGAIRLEASDVHLEPEEKQIQIRYRLDGILSKTAELNKESFRNLLSRIKIVSGLKINIRQAPQDGRFTIRHAQKEIEVRVSVLPGAYGENVVLRLLDPATLKHRIEELGMSSGQTEKIKELLAKTTGALLTTGPTGSGKTTALYAFLNFVNRPGIKIITIEDPIEYHLLGISQTQVAPAKGYTFASGLRSIVRQDPDVILVGEIRDSETAEIAMQAALTGHLVFSTLHANDAAGAIPRLIDLGGKPVSIAPALNAVMAQRLVRRLCSRCRQEKTITKEDLQFLKTFLAAWPAGEKALSLNAQTKIFYPQNCEFCRRTGYKGRTGVFEILPIDEAIREIILTSPSVSQMNRLAAEKGMLSMRHDGLQKVLNGITSIEEIKRVLQ